MYPRLFKTKTALKNYSITEIETLRLEALHFVLVERLLSNSNLLSRFYCQFSTVNFISRFLSDYKLVSTYVVNFPEFYQAAIYCQYSADNFRDLTWIPSLVLRQHCFPLPAFLKRDARAIFCFVDHVTLRLWRHIVWLFWYTWRQKLYLVQLDPKMG